MIAIKVARPFLLQGLQSFYRFSTALPSTSASYATTTINRPWKSNSEFSARVPTDQVIPFHVLDDGYVNRNVVMEASYRFDDVLDVDRLRLALHRLMQRDGWKKLGARIRQNASSQSGKQKRLEYILPREYDDKRPPFLWSHEKFKQNIAEHPKASQLPRASQTPKIHENPHLMQSFLHHPGRPRKLADWLKSDSPPLSFKTLSFQDATILSVSWPHCVFDGIGRAAFMNAWLAELNGLAIPEFIGFDHDPMSPLIGEVPGERYLLRHQLLTGSRLLFFVLRTIFDLILQPKSEPRILQIPDRFLQKLRQEALTDLNKGYTGEDAIFVSNGDVLLAWWARTVLSSQNLAVSRPVAIGTALNLRKALKKDLPSGTFIGNAVSTVFAFLTAHELATIPLGSIALRIRRAIEQQRTTEQVKAQLTLMEFYGRQPLAGPWNMLPLVLSQSNSLGFFDLDFSCAVVRQGLPDNRRRNEVGRPSYIHLTHQLNGVPGRNAGSVLGKDAAGNWWIYFDLPVTAWKGVYKKLKALDS
ncbi:hypothetical protein COCC4DRAFT_155047 [Bipolaris maydis ATCC 48331]|uniref:Uncharacterized protein n=2 Tax=Cochliobolus heterostrophus TaxID=5016 RepID=M2UGP1_COCH5|nr:uncharacterized protein COCC4DRAFT_155047 [Bipolaris maydis ATCC 48331]EMD87158.1 hypothetical protein COCHEDRAFT_1185673 [Bipolaris maydis C5]KAJ5021533.1 hypothetical protein J3E73DRAFT_219935 [Bipolaris maydis]ENH98738.1 hypothetical protein COCC4DRAFT_155047 [Bipolaris maydis ATCC 48331]KAJ6204463.1 hypothetical protein PSV09DRAFT_1185673 [Bipolaris maydis]KAJ6265632.1 hypothetical protein PSV08DRAFT_211133 [Bipolaris maydis]